MGEAEIRFDELRGAARSRDEPSPFGALLSVSGSSISEKVGAILEAREEIVEQFHRVGGLLLVRGLEDLRAAPDLLVRISEIFGPEVENVRQTLTSGRFFHESVPELMVLSNEPPVGHPPPPLPSPSRTPEGALVVSHPHQTNWHTDQSYRRPPPDVTLLFGVVTPPPDQGQTLFADCSAAFEALDADTKKRLRALDGLHAPSWVGRRPEDVRAGVTPKPLLPHQRPVRQPLARRHPATHRLALYLCQPQQMDFVEGPIVGLEIGPDGAGAALLEQLLRHATQARFVYTHEWTAGDLVIADNRCLLHCATWYAADRYPRLMWRTTVQGEPGAEYAGEAKSWMPRDGEALMAGMEGV
ncbi:MAG: TauD/TfdA family dioxygenase [Pseudomonadota bacterium]